MLETTVRARTFGPVPTRKEPQKSGGTYPLVELGMGVTGRIMDITPELAEKWLAKRQVQRKQRRPSVNMMSRLQIAGEWRFNGQPIIFNTKDELADGQHRLAACANSGKTITCLVLWGVPAESFETMDSGTARTSADALHASGYKKTVSLASAAKLIFQYENGIAFSDFVGIKMSPLETSQLVNSYPKLVDSHHMGIRVHKICRSEAVPTFCHFVFNRVAQKACAEFFDKLESGEELPKGHPILELRRRLIAQPLDKRIKQHELIHWLFKTWNAVRKGEELGQLRVGPNEKLPKPI